MDLAVTEDRMPAKFQFALLMLAMTNLAWAQQLPTFTQLDADDDGFVTRREAQAHSAVSAEFDSIDHNRDGRLDEAEYGRWRAMQENRDD